MNVPSRIAFIGAGNMAEAILRGLLDSKLSTPEQVIAADPNAARIQQLVERYAIHGTTSNLEAVEHADLVVLAVKPQVMAKVLEEVAQRVVPAALFVSIAAGIDCAQIESSLQQNLEEKSVRVVRVMPNTPALVRRGASAIAAGSHALEEDLQQVRELFDAVGSTVVVQESELDAVTALSGSGPAYVFLLVEAMARAGQAAGLSEALANQLARQTVVGAASMLEESSEGPDVLRARVTSPGGTTEAALTVLSAGPGGPGLWTLLDAAVKAAARRSVELKEALRSAADEDQN